MDVTKVEAFQNINVLVAGDYILDNYVGGEVRRVSVEAPVPVLNVKWEKSHLGGAGNVVNNIRALSARAKVLSCIGQDESGDKLISLLRNIGADVSFLMRKPELSTVVKTRIVAKNQQIVRIDREEETALPDEFFKFVSEHLDEIFAYVDILLLSDYGKGTLTEDITQLLIKKANDLGIPVFVDPKGTEWKKYYGATVCTPNLNELSAVSGQELTHDMDDEIYNAAYDLCKRLDIDYILVTRSEKGMVLVSSEGVKTDYPARKKEVVDVVGAGDTVISTLALSMFAGFDMGTCCQLANAAAAVVISKFGTATVDLHELIGTEIVSSGRKRVTQEEIYYVTKFLKRQGKRIAFTNGCFDLVHAGHIFSLEKARSYGDVLIVGINSDESVRKLKGDKHPILDEDNRSYLLQSLAVVDYVIIFNEDTPEQLIRRVRPDVLVKGRDYYKKEIAGREFVESYGGTIVLTDSKKEISTTAIIQEILDEYR